MAALPLGIIAAFPGPRGFDRRAGVEETPHLPDIPGQAVSWSPPWRGGAAEPAEEIDGGGAPARF